MKKTYSIFLETLGCRLNHSETSMIAGSLVAKGHRIASSISSADFCLLNSCTVTAQSDAKCRQKIRSYQKQGVKTAVVGCYSQVDAQRLVSMEVDIVVGNQQKLFFADYLDRFTKEQKQLVDVQRISTKNFTLPEKNPISDRTRANLKIQDGCNFVCAFCIIPFARGRARSRDFEDLKLEVRQLASLGYKEIVLTGVNIGTYQEKEHSFLSILELLQQTAGIDRVRISSIEPTTVPVEIFSLMKDEQSKVLPFLHLPLQSGSNETLKAMRRKYSLIEYSDFLLLAYEKVPDICLGTDIIIGFPTETKEEFEKSYQTLHKLPFHFFHTFPFSSREGTRASHFKNVVSNNELRERCQKVRILSVQKRNSFYKKQLGKIKKVLFESQKEDSWFGYTENFVRVKTRKSNLQKNTIQKVRIYSVENLLANAELVL